ncbi:MAG: hypothetical protein DHS20C17_33540 [Cyclobacteriaceae bacterium]|nr:MAG: hypothetical protein DHS20C17_33540 [Cyclobacteriaceae bacterium]
MKKVTLVLSLIIYFTLSDQAKVVAQNAPVDGVILKGYGAYVFDNSFDARFDFGQYYDGKIKGGFQWGVGLEYRLHPDTGVELMYFRQDTNAPTDYLIGVEPEFTDFDMGINYIMLGGVRSAELGAGNIEAFGGGMLGVMFANATNPDTGGDGSVTKFAWGLKGGLIFWASEKAGLILQAQLLSAVQSVGGGLYFGTGGGGAGVSTYSTLYQFGLGGGLAFKLN